MTAHRDIVQKLRQRLLVSRGRFGFLKVFPDQSFADRRGEDRADIKIIAAFLDMYMAIFQIRIDGAEFRIALCRIGGPGLFWLKFQSFAYGGIQRCSI